MHRKKMRRLIIIILLTILLSSCSTASDPDQGLYEGAPQNLLLQSKDLPGAYVLMEELSGERPNEGLKMDSEDPQALEQYLDRTGRITGWENHFMLIEPTQTLPGFILNQAVVYESAVGAQNALNWPSVQIRETVETDRVIGDAMTLTMMPFKAPDDSDWIDYRVEFTYKNLLGVIITYAPEAIATPDYALDLAEVLLQNFNKQFTDK
jgi:hypothetical protein